MKRTRNVSVVCVTFLGMYTAAVQAEEYKIDPGHSSVIFRVKHLDVSYAYGRFNDIAGSFSFDSGSLDIELKTESIDTNSPDRDKHLKGPDFFNAKQFPITKFTSKKFKKTGDDTYQVIGSLTLHGVTKPLTLTVERVGSGKDRRGRDLTGFEATFTIKRSDFGMTYAIPGIGDEVRMIVSIEGARE